MDILWIVVGTLAGLVIGYFAGKYRQNLKLEAKYKVDKEELDRLNKIDRYGTWMDATVIDRKIISRKSDEITYILHAQWHGPETGKVNYRQETFTVNTKYVQTHNVPEIGSKVHVLHILRYDGRTASYIERP